MPFVSTDHLLVQRLFSREPLAARIEKYRSRTEKIVEGIDGNEILVTPVNDLVATVVALNALSVLRLLEEQAHMETPVEFWNAFDENGKEMEVAGLSYQLTIPFEGDSDLFFLTPDEAQQPTPIAKVFQKNLIIRVAGYDVSLEEVKTAIDQTLIEIKLHLAAQAQQIAPFTKQLNDDARSAVERRRKRILDSLNIASSIGYPLRRNTDDIVHHISTDVGRRAPPRQQPRNSGGAFTPEPALDDAEYQHILKVLSDMTLVMERAPSAFKRLEEEHIRDFFLAVLNTHYEGNATGETFNKSGKTDILIRDNARNVFIAECKIWRGAHGFGEAIDQLLGYLSWRDTKAAVIVFNRNQDFSHVLSEIRASITKHPHRKAGPEVKSQTRFRSVFGNPADHNREIILTVMAFDVPI